MRTIWRLALLASIVLAPQAHATGLVEALRLAQEHDPEFAAARAAHEAGQARRAQASALWRPTLALSGTAGRMSNNTQVGGAQFSAPGLGQSNGASFNTSVNDGISDRWALSARQPLISGERRAQSRALALGSDMAELEWRGASQALILRLAECYFDVALARQSLRVLREQQLAVDRALAEAQERFRLGDIPITDSHEAKARSEAIYAQVLAAETELEIKQFALSDLTGLDPRELDPMIPAPGPIEADVGKLEHWLSEAASGNPNLRMQAAGVEMAAQEAIRYRAVSSPSVDLVAELGRERLAGSGDFGPAGSNSRSAMIGVQLTVPLFTGGYRSARQQEALGLADRARADERHTRQQIALQTRAAWLGLTVGANRVAALSAALQASRDRLDATRLGHKVGDRTTLDLLGAQSDAAAAEVGLLQARVALVLERLRLAGLAGSLDEQQLQALDSRLQTSRVDSTY